MAKARSGFVAFQVPDDFISILKNVCIGSRSKISKLEDCDISRLREISEKNFRRKQQQVTCV